MTEHDQAIATEARTHRTTEERPAEEREDPDACPECGSAGVVDPTHGETVCEECGFVIDRDLVDRGPEWRAFDPGERSEKSRVGAPTTKLMHDEGLSSQIDWQNRDAYGRSLTPEKRRKMDRLRDWDEKFRTKSASERNLKQALTEIKRMAAALGLPGNVGETAGVIYRRALEDDLVVGRSIEAMATAALYAAARQAGTPRSLDEFEPVSRVDRMEFARAYRYVVRELGLPVEPADPESYLPRFASELGVSDEVERRARELLGAAKSQAILSGKSPVGMAGAAIYAGSILANEKITQGAIAEAIDVSTVTIRDRYQELLEAADSEGIHA